MHTKLRNIYKGKKVLITGHTGFKGGWLSLWLAQLGAKVVGYSLEPPTQPNFFDAVGLERKITHIIGDVRDEKRVLSLFKKHAPEFVFHMAAQSLVRLSYKEPRLTYETNTMGTVNILEACRSTNSTRVCIVVTSDKCYENRESFYRYKEADRLGGYDPYSSSKASAELVTAAYRRSFFNPGDYGKTHSLALASARAGNIIGGGDWAGDRILPDCVKALSGKRTISVRNPQAVRPWHYVLESLSAYLSLGARMHRHPAKFSEAWNFGPEEKEKTTVEKLVKLVLEYWGGGNYKIEKKPYPYEAGLLRLDTDKARGALSWRPRYNIAEAVRKTIDWYKLFYNKSTRKGLFEFTVNEINEYSKNV